MERTREKGTRDDGERGREQTVGGWRGKDMCLLAERDWEYCQTGTVNDKRKFFLKYRQVTKLKKDLNH